ncbi:MAG: DUF2752 domain-containing protein [Eubacterium sp.]|nr:DUF2752 domain-containing protein [Eubacterium sp.]
MKGYIAAVCGRIASDVKEYGMAGVVFIAYAVIVNLIFHAFCPLVIFSGFPCPGCGVTRAAVCLVTGRFRQAWQLHPVVFAVMLTAVYFCVNRYLLGRKAIGIKWMVAAVFVLLVGVYLVRMCRYFPDRAPYVYNEDNMLARMLPFYSEILHKAGIL